MESRWIYREVEDELARRLPESVYPHTVLTKRLRFDVAETRDVIRFAVADYGSKAAWYSRKADSSGAEKVNEARKAMYDALPYAGRSVPASKRAKDGESGSMSPGEALMWKFIRERDASRAGGEEWSEG